MANQGFKVMDSDMHVMEPPDLWERYIDPAFEKRAPKYMGDPLSIGFGSRWLVEGKVFPAHAEEGTRTQSLGGRHEAISDQFADGRASMFDSASQLRAMDAEGIDLAILFRTFGAHVIALDGMDPDLALALCRAFNDWLADFCKASPQRMKGAAQLPMHDVEKAVQEATRAVTELGMVALVLPSNPVNRRPWYDSYYEPLWTEAERLNVPVCFHGIHGAYQDHVGNRFLDSFVVAHASTHPLELMMDCASMICGGVLERHPNLRVGFMEGNCSWVPWWLWRLEEEWENFGPWVQAKLQATPQEYFQRQCFASVEPDERTAYHVIQEMGDDNLVLSTDYPHHDSAWPHAINRFLSLEGLDAKSKGKILWDNCARLFNVG